jgi:hypothetical protein
VYIDDGVCDPADANTTCAIATQSVDSTSDVPERDFTRFGIDFQGDIAGARLQAMYVSAEDDTYGNGVITGSQKNTAIALQGMYIIKTKEGTPTFVPLVRFDSYEKNDGKDEYQDLTLNLTYYMKENVKGYVEYWNQLDAPDGVDKDSRVTLQLYVGF